MTNFMNHSGLYPLLPSLSSLFEDYYWEECLDRLKKSHQLPIEYQAETLPISQTTANYVFGILNDQYVWKSKLGKITRFSDENSDVESSNQNEMYEHLNLHLFSPYMSTIRELFIATTNNFEETVELNNDSIKWKAVID